MSVVGETVNISGQSNSLPVKVPPSKLSEDLAQLLESSNCSDVTLSIGVKEFKVHKSILSGIIYFLVLSVEPVDCTQCRQTSAKSGSYVLFSLVW